MRKTVWLFVILYFEARPRRENIPERDEKKNIARQTQHSHM